MSIPVCYEMHFLPKQKDFKTAKVLADTPEYWILIDVEMYITSSFRFELRGFALCKAAVNLMVFTRHQKNTTMFNWPLCTLPHLFTVH